MINLLTLGVFVLHLQLLLIPPFCGSFLSSCPQAPIHASMPLGVVPKRSTGHDHRTPPSNTLASLSQPTQRLLKSSFCLFCIDIATLVSKPTSFSF